MALLVHEVVLFLSKQLQIVAPGGIKPGSLEQYLQVLTTTLLALTSIEVKKFLYFATKVVLYSYVVTRKSLGEKSWKASK